jgi:protocatechuate 3,4-dioxygenase beta subunit
MRKSILGALLAVSSMGLAATDPPQVRFALSAHEGDSTVPVLINAAVPLGTTHRLQATDHLTFEVSVAPSSVNGRVDTSVKLIDDASGKAVPVANTRWIAPATEERSFAYTVCPDQRLIFLRPIPASVAKCADLPPMAKTDPDVGDCPGCLGVGPYEGMPTTLTSVSRIAPADEPGEPLVITGRVFGPDGKPRRGVIVYAYHTNRHGIYPAPDPPRSEQSNFHGRLRGWALTDAKGRYTFNTIRPASYPDTTITQHIHMHIVERGCATYYIDEMLFTDDPFFKKLSPEDVARENKGRGGSGITTPHRDASGTWHVTRDIYLGKNIPEYMSCPQSD